MSASATDENFETKGGVFHSMVSAFRGSRSRLIGNDVLKPVMGNGIENGHPLPNITLHQVRCVFNDWGDCKYFPVAQLWKNSNRLILHIVSLKFAWWKHLVHNKKEWLKPRLNQLKQLSKALTKLLSI